MKKTILVADDNPVIRALLKATFRNEAENQVIFVNDGGEALDLARRELPDLIFLDNAMPMMNGIDVCRELRADPATAGARIIMVTAYPQGHIRAEALEAGADAYITKPFSPLELLQIVDETGARSTAAAG